MKTDRYELHSQEIPENQVEEIMESAIRENNDLRKKGVYPDFRHFIEPNGSGFDIVQLIDSDSSYTAVYFHVGEEVRKEGNIGWDRAVEILSYDPREKV